MNTGHVTWDAVPGALAYRVEYKKSADPTYILFSSFHTSLVANIPGLAHKTFYDFQITAICNAGDSTPSIITAETPCGKITFDYSSTGYTGGPTCSMTVNWDLSDAGIDTIEVKWKKNADPFYGPPVVVAYSAGSYTITGLQLCTNYDISFTSFCDIIQGEEIIVQEYTPVNLCNRFILETYNYVPTDVYITDLYQSPGPYSSFHYIPSISPGGAFRSTYHNFTDFPLLNYDLHLNNTGVTPVPVFLEMIRSFTLVNTTMPIIVPPGISTVSIMLVPGPVGPLESLRINLKRVGEVGWPDDPDPPPDPDPDPEG